MAGGQRVRRITAKKATMQGASDNAADNAADHHTGATAADEILARPRFRPRPWEHLETPYDVEVWIEEHNAQHAGLWSCAHVSTACLVHERVIRPDQIRHPLMTWPNGSNRSQSHVDTPSEQHP